MHTLSCRAKENIGYVNCIKANTRILKIVLDNALHRYIIDSYVGTIQLITVRCIQVKLILFRKNENGVSSYYVFAPHKSCLILCALQQLIRCYSTRARRIRVVFKVYDCTLNRSICLHSNNRIDKLLNSNMSNMMVQYINLYLNMR